MIKMSEVDFTVTHVAMVNKSPEEIFAMIENVLIKTNEQYCDSMCSHLGYIFPRRSDTGRKKTLAILICNKIWNNKELRNNANVSRIPNPDIQDNLPPFILTNIYNWLTKKGE